MELDLPNKDDVLDEVVDTLMGKESFFEPITVNRGRKFRGNCFYLSSREASNGGFAGNGARPLAYYTINTAWDPQGKQEVQFNGHIGSDNGIDPWEASYDEKATALMDYVDHICAQCVSKCGEDRVYRMRWLRKVLGLPTDLAEDLAKVIGPEVNENTKITLTIGQLRKLVKEHIEFLQRIQRKRDPNRQEFLISFNDTKFDPLDTLYHRDMRVFARNEREALAMVKDEHPEFKVTKITLV